MERYSTWYGMYAPKQLGLIAIIDHKNLNNSITVYDLVKDEDSIRKLKVLYNMGITFNYTYTKTANGSNSVVIRANKLGSDFNPNCFYISSLANDEDRVQLAAHFTPIQPNNVSEMSKNLCGAICKNLGIDSSDQRYNNAVKLSEHISNDLAKYMEVIGNSSVIIPLYRATGDLSNYPGGTVDYGRSNLPNYNSDEPSETLIDLRVPEYYQLIAQKNSTEKAFEQGVINYGSDEDDSIITDVENSVTNEFEESEDSLVGSNWKEYYKNSSDVDFSIIGKELHGNNIVNVITTKVPCRFDSVTEFYDVVGNRPPHSFKKDSTGKYYTEKDVVGDALNNNLPIQPNEVYLYNKLTDLVTIGVSIENDALSYEVYNELPTTSNSDVVDEYLKILARQAYNANWSHTGHGDDSTEDVEDTENEADKDVYESKLILPCRYGNVIKSPEGKYVFKSGFNFTQITNNEYIDTVNDGTSIGLASNESRVFSSLSADDQSKYLNAKINSELPNINKGFPALSEFISEVPVRNKWAECVIKLLRFGHRKPNLLTISGYDEGYWDLNSKSKTYFDGNIGNYKNIINPLTNGKYYLEAIITNDLKASVPGVYKLPLVMQNIYQYPSIDMNDDAVLKYPIGFVFRERFEGNKVTKLDIVDAYEFVQIVKSKESNYNFGYVSYDDNGFVMTTDDSFDISKVPTIELKDLSIFMDESKSINDRYNNYYCNLILSNIELSGLKDDPEVEPVYNSINDIKNMANLPVSGLLNIYNTLNTSDNEKYKSIRYCFANYPLDVEKLITVNNASVLKLALTRIPGYTNLNPNDKDVLTEECRNNYNLMYAMLSFNSLPSISYIERGKALFNSTYTKPSVITSVNDANCSIIYKYLPRVFNLALNYYDLSTNSNKDIKDNLATICQNIEDSISGKPVKNLESYNTVTEPAVNTADNADGLSDNVKSFFDGKELKMFPYYSNYCGMVIDKPTGQCLVLTIEELDVIKASHPEIRFVDMSGTNNATQFINNTIKVLLKMHTLVGKNGSTGDKFVINSNDSLRSIINLANKIIGDDYKNIADYYSKVLKK